MSDSRWFVEKENIRFDDVGAADLEIESGCLVFRDANGKIILAYAAGTWNTVSEGAE